MQKKIRTFKTGANRDTEEGKLDYEGFLSPIVLQKFAEYMNKHRVQSDGKLRDSDNWQKGFGDKHFEVCMKSLTRHFMDLWLEMRGFDSREGMKDALMGILFNTMSFAHILFKDEVEIKNFKRDTEDNNE